MSTLYKHHLAFFKRAQENSKERDDRKKESHCGKKDRGFKETGNAQEDGRQENRIRQIFVETIEEARKDGNCETDDSGQTGHRSSCEAGSGRETGSAETRVTESVKR
jgi:hypothetical protein